MTTDTYEDRLRKLRRQVGLPVAPKPRRAVEEARPSTGVVKATQASPAGPNLDALTKARDEGIEEGYRKAREELQDEVGDMMFSWFKKSVISNSRVTKSQMSKLRDAMVEADVKTANDVLDVLKDAGIVEFDGDMFEAVDDGA